MKIPPVAARSSGKPQAARFGLHSPGSTDSRRGQRLPGIHGDSSWRVTRVDAIDVRAEREMQAIVDRAHAASDRRDRAERHRIAMMDLAATIRQAVLRGAAMALTDLPGAARYLAAAAAISIAHKSRLRREFRVACRDCSIKREIYVSSNPDIAPVAPPDPGPEAPPVRELHGPKDRAERAEWERTVRQYQTTRPQRKGCEAWTIGQQAFDFAEFRTLTVHCGCWDCGVCGPRVAAMWHQHLVPFLREAGPLFLVQVERGAAWEAFSRRVLRAKGDHVRAMRADGGFAVLTTVNAPGAVPVDNPEAALVAILSAVPRSTNGSARRITTSAGWKLATRRGAKKAEPETIVEAVATETPAVPTPWQTVVRAPVSVEAIRDVLEDEGVEFAVYGNGRQSLVTRWSIRDQVQGARIWGRIFAPVRERMAA